MLRHAQWIRRGLLSVGLLLLAPGIGAAQTFSSGSTGADGAFAPACTPTPCTVTVTLPPSGVFNFTTITIPAGVTVAFTRNAANMPVTMLATGDATLAGTIRLDGQPGQDAVAGIVSGLRAGRGGPGGFDGGEGGKGLITTSGVPGLGPGGGRAGFFQSFFFGGPLVPGGGSGASYADRYGSPALLPLLGGSGGAGGAGNAAFDTGGAGGGGGGAILIASSTRIVFTGRILAQGGSGGNVGTLNVGAGGGGSGGGVRLVANTLEGSGGLITVAGGAGGTGGPSFGTAGGPGGQGRIRLEAFDVRLAASFSATPSLAKPGSVFLPNSPVLRIASVAGVSTPATPTGTFATPDVILPATTVNPVTVGITASRIPLGTVVRVTVASIVEPFQQVFTGTGLSGTPENSTASASVTIFGNQPAVLSAEATFTLLAAAGWGPIYAEGEEVKWVRVAATYGGPSTVTYITASGREVPAEALLSGVANQ